MKSNELSPSSPATAVRCSGLALKLRTRPDLIALRKASLVRKTSKDQVNQCYHWSLAYGRSTANFSLVVLNYRDLKVIPVLIPSSAQAQRMPSWQAMDSTSREGSPLPPKPLATLTVMRTSVTWGSRSKCMLLSAILKVIRMSCSRSYKLGLVSAWRSVACSTVFTGG